MLSKLARLNYRRGFFRLWVVAALVWVGFAITQAQSEISYTVRYLVNYDGIQQTNKSEYEQNRVRLRSRLKYLEEEEKKQKSIELTNKSALDDYEKMLKKAGIEAKKPTNEFSFEEAFRVNQTPEQELLSIKVLLETPENTAPVFPDLRWLATVFLPPPLVGLGLVLVFSITGFVFRWIGRGFTQNTR